MCECVCPNPYVCKLTRYGWNNLLEAMYILGMLIPCQCVCHSQKAAEAHDHEPEARQP
jgi:hypothetical protein